MQFSGKSLRQQTSTSSPWLDCSVWTVALWASFLNLLNFHDYPPFRAEVGLALIGLALGGALMGAVQHLARPRLSFLFAALFAAFMIDLNSSIALGWFYVLWGCLAVVAFFAQTLLLRITLAAFAGVLAFQSIELATGNGDASGADNMAQNLQQADRPDAKRPAIVHLVFDSYLGLDGMALGPAVYRDLRAEQLAFFTGEGFQLYPHAYTRHTRTLNSLPNLFSYGEAPPAIHAINPQYSVPEELPYFIDLDTLGYRTSALLPRYFDLCVNQKLTRCRNFDSSALTSILGTELSVVDRAKVFGFTLLQLTNLPNQLALFIQVAANDYLKTEGQWPFNRSKLYPLESLRQLDRFTEELGTLRPGEARVVHLLLPHSPYELNANCTVKPENAWLNEHGPGSEARREAAYADQVRCLQRRIARMLEVLNRTRAGREAIVLIHGDHGSRIAPQQPFLERPELNDRQLLMSYLTFFAIRVPGEAANQVPGAHALDDLMADFRARDFTSAPRPMAAPSRVYSLDEDGNARAGRPLPMFHPKS
jgi:hypothetical protein